MRAFRKMTSALAAVVFLATWSAPPAARADSPLTSADFQRAYPDLPEVRTAGASGRLDDALADYLLDPGRSYAETAAVINALGRACRTRLE